MNHPPSSASCRKAWALRGFSLIELLVSLAIGLIVTLAITTVLISSNANQRTSTGVNDAVQTGDFASLSIDLVMRSAGSGFIQFRRGMGCLINASLGGAQILPPDAAHPLPFPFDKIGVTHPVQLAPVVIINGGVGAGGEEPDRLIIMSGSHGFSQAALPMKPSSATANTARIGTTLGLNPNDLVLVADGKAGSSCMVQQVLSTDGSLITFGNNYFASNGFNTTLASFATRPTATVLPIGSEPNLPSFFAYGVDAKDNLVRYNLLSPQPAATTVPELLAEGVVSIQAIYGIDAATGALNGTAPTPTTLDWVAPTGLDAATAGGLLSGSEASKNLFPGIKAVRLAMVLKSAVEEKPPVPPAPPVSPATLTMFADTAIPVIYTVPPTAKNFRYRVVETLIPLRNL